ncbi:MAG TPA: sigma-70 family RNA polymerase sigma factor [Acidobacteriota bacterium]|nr:sigma-70 family RNA polymerase sigma factor [Acidobacteriota bacterium]
MSPRDEARWTDRLASGDPSAFRDFVEAYKNKVYGLAYEMTRNHADAEDVAQVAFMKVHRAVRTIRPGGGLNSWLYQIVYNTAVDHIRKRSILPRETLSPFGPDAPVEGPPDPAPGPEAEAEAACLRRRIDAALTKISERERAVFILRHYHDLKLKEIAASLGITLGAAKSYLFRSLRKLQKELGGAEPCPDKGERP